MTCDHLRPLLDSPRDLHTLFLVAESFSQGLIPRSVVETVKLGWMTALRKKDGGVRGIVASEVIRRLTARTIAQQLGPAVEAATAPFQYALSTRAGCECVSHALQALRDMDEDGGITSIDGISAYDTISRRAMLQGLEKVPGGSAASPFVRLFHAEPSTYPWQDDVGTTHRIHQGEGGEQGDPLMPLLYSLGQHAALEAMQARLHPGEKLFAHLDDVWLVSQPERVGQVHNVAEHELWTHAKIQVHRGKTHVWNRSGRKPPNCDEMQRAAEAADPNTRVWRGSKLPTTEQGIKILGCPLGHEDFVSAQLEATTRKHQALLQAIPTVPDIQSGWSLLLHCAAARANCQLRVLRPDVVSSFARAHDAGVWQCLCAVLRIPDTSCKEVARLSASLPLALGGLGLRSAVRTSAAAHWSSWADTLPMIHQRHPVVATRIVHALAQEVDSPVLGAVRRAGQELEGDSGFVVPSWPALTAGLRPPPREPEFHEPKGWLATRSGQSRGEAVPNNFGFATAFTVNKGHVEVPEWTNGRSCVLCFALLSLDAFPAHFVPCPSAATPCSSLAFDFAQLPVWPSS